MNDQQTQARTGQARILSRRGKLLNSVFRNVAAVILLAGAMEAQTLSKEYIRLGDRVITIKHAATVPFSISADYPVMGPGETSRIVVTGNAGCTVELEPPSAGSLSGVAPNVLYTAPAQAPTPPEVSIQAECGTSSASTIVTVRPVLSATSVNFDESAHENNTITVTKKGEWTAVSNDTAWLHITSSEMNTGNSSVVYSVDANNGVGRTGTLTIAGQTFTVQQTSSTITVTPSTISAPSDGQSYEIAVDGSGWIPPTPAVGWLHPTVHADLQGFTLVVDSNDAPNSSSRQGVVTVGNKSVTVTQAGTAISFIPPYLSIPGEGRSGTVQVIADPTLNWDVTGTSSAWISAWKNPTDPQGVMTFGYQIAQNLSGTSRQGTIQVGGRNYWVLQSEGGFSVSPQTVNLYGGQWAQFEAHQAGGPAGAVNWSLNPALGTINGGLYWAPDPSLITEVTTILVTATNASGQSDTATITLMPLAYGGEVFTIQLWDTQGGVVAPVYFNLGMLLPNPPDNYADRVELLVTKNTIGENGPESVANSCYIQVYPGDFVSSPSYQWLYGQVRLASDNGAFSDLNWRVLGAGAPDENSQCKISPANSYVNVSPAPPNYMHTWMDLQLQFKPAFEGGTMVLARYRDIYGVWQTSWTIVGAFGVIGYQPPSVHIDAPAANALVPKSQVPISGWALDNETQAETAIQKVEILVDGVKVADATYGEANNKCSQLPGRPGCATAGFTYTWNTQTVSGGVHTISAVATDSDGNPNRSSTATIAVNVQDIVDLKITKNHSGNFWRWQSGATYTITVTNAGSRASSGTVTVTDTLPAGLSLVSMQGAGWTCNSATCTRSDALSAGASFAPITVTVNVASDAPASVVNAATVSGGGDAIATNNAATDPTTIEVSQLPANLYYQNVSWTSGVQLFQALNSVVAENNVSVSGSANVTFKAGSFVRLGPGFQATSASGATFHAVIDPTIH